MTNATGVIMHGGNLMNPKVAASRTHPLHFRRHGVIFAKSRELQIATLSLLLLFLIAPALQAQTPQPQPPAVRETARPGIAQGFLGWFRQFAPSPRRQSRAASPPPLPRPRPAELTPTPAEPSPASAERAPASGEPLRLSLTIGGEEADEMIRCGYDVRAADPAEAVAAAERFISDTIACLDIER
jgi:hypothetical protein